MVINNSFSIIRLPRITDLVIYLYKISKPKFTTSVLGPLSSLSKRTLQYMAIALYFQENKKYEINHIKIKKNYL